MTSLITGLLLGAFSSIHCAGMCGPILLTVNKFGSDRRQDAVARIVVYQIGRVAAYATLGAAAGYTGSTIASSGFSRVLAGIAGVLLLAVAVGMTVRSFWQPVASRWSSLVMRVGLAAMRLVRTHPVRGHMSLGFAHALLPCGPLYSAIAASALLGSVSDAVLFMASFGIGTAPLLLGVAVSPALIPPRVRRPLRFAAPVLIALAGSLLIARGIRPSGQPHHLHSHQSILSSER